MYYTVSKNRFDGGHDHICAPAGYCRDYKTGEIKRDGSAAPEMTRDSTKAYQFPNRKYAEMQAAKLVDGQIVES